MSSQLSPEQRSLNGGRSLNAIWDSPRLDCYEKLFLQFLGSCADFSGDFTDFSFHSLKKLEEATSLSRRKLLYVAKDLEEKSYILREKRFFVQDNTKAPSNYSLTKKIFDEYILILRERDAKKAQDGAQYAPGSAQYALGVVHSVHEGSAQRAHDLPQQTSPISNSPSLSLNPPLVASKVEKTEGSKIWDAYKEAYERRYRVAPVRNAKTNSQCASLHKRLGENAVEVITFYLTHNAQKYVANCHPIGFALSDAESLNTQMLNGKAVTHKDAVNVDKRQTTMNSLERALELMRGKSNG